MPVSAHTSARISRRASAQAALERALRESEVVRREQLAVLTRRYPDHAPIWLALAEDHLGKRRNEEARYAARKALALDGSIARRFSPELAKVCASMMPPDHRARPRGRSSELASEMLEAEKMRARIRSQGDADVELAQAKRLPGIARCERIEALSRRFPTHAPTWLALAEEFIAQRRVERSLDAFERALVLDPGQARFASPKLETARRYHDRAAPARYQPRASEDSAEDSMGKLASGFSLPVPVPKSGPNERTRNLPMSQVKRPDPKTIPPYLRTPSGSYRPARAESQVHTPVGRQLAEALELPSRTQRLGALLALETQAPGHPGVLFHLAVHLVLADRLDEARRTGERLSRLDSTRYRQLYEWADEWSRSLQQASSNSVKAANARTLCLQLAGNHGPAPASHTGDVYKTQLLAVPVPVSLAHGSSPVPAPVAGVHDRASSASESTPAGRRLRTAGALIAGIAAGLLVAMLLVFVINSAGSLAPSEHESEPTSTRVTAPSKTRLSSKKKSSVSKEGPLTAAEQAAVEAARTEQR